MTDKEIRRVLNGREPKKSKDICSELGITDRAWRKIVKKYNDSYDTKERLIVSNKHGYKFSTDKKAIKNYAIRLINHGLAELNDGKAIIEALSHKNQLILGESDTDLVDSVMKLDL